VKEKNTGGVTGKKSNAGGTFHREACLTVGDGNYKLQGGVGGREGDHSYVFESGFAACGQHIVLCNFLFSFGINDP
jgi:hypothetical protein